jgi:hypothetical protein
MVARSSRTARYSSASLASSSRTWASCALMSAPLGGEVGRAWPRALEWSSSWVEGVLPIASSCRVRAIRLVVDHDEALPRGVIIPGAGVVGVVEPVVCGVKEPLEHHRVRYAGEVPLCVPVRSGGWQLAGGAVVGLVVGGGGEVSSRQEVGGGMSFAHRHVRAGGRSVRHRGVAHAMGELRFGNRTHPAGAVAISPVVASHCEATHAARRHSIRACAERWPERRRCHGVEGPAASAWTGAWVSAPGVAGTGPVDRHG